MKAAVYITSPISSTNRPARMVKPPLMCPNWPWGSGDEIAKGAPPLAAPTANHATAPRVTVAMQPASIGYDGRPISTSRRASSRWTPTPTMMAPTASASQSNAASRPVPDGQGSDTPPLLM